MKAARKLYRDALERQSNLALTRCGYHSYRRESLGDVKSLFLQNLDYDTFACS